MADLVFQLQEGRAPRTAQIRARMLGALPAEVRDSLVDTIRTGGPGSVADQFARQAEMTSTASFPWERTRDFGTRKAPRRTLHRSGALEAAWTGRGPGAIARARGPRGVEVGVDTARFPQARMFQRRGITANRVTGRQRAYLGHTDGVWLKQSTTHLHVAGRPVSMNRQILGRARKIITRYYAHGLRAAAAPRRRAA